MNINKIFKQSLKKDKEIKELTEKIHKKSLLIKDLEQELFLITSSKTFRFLSKARNQILKFKKIPYKIRVILHWVNHHIKLYFFPSKLEVPKILIDENFKEEFKYEKNKSIKTNLKYIAFYLPQFHRFQENDKFWGKGFTEWTNVTKAKSQYENHNLPNLPGDLGFYDLRIPETLIEQSELAENYGIDAFCFYFYWFNGKVLMEKVLDNFIKNKNIKLEFCLSWANENWTRAWDGLENEVLLKQNHNEKDSLDFIKYIMKYFKDERYIKIKGKPVLIIYNPQKIDNLKFTIKQWENELKNEGFKGIYLISQRPKVLKMRSKSIQKKKNIFEISDLEAAEYIASYPDLFNLSLYEAKNHILNSGIKENRKISFDSKIFINSNKEVKDLFSNAPQKACYHYIKNFGKYNFQNFEGFDLLIDFLPTNLNSACFKSPNVKKKKEFTGSLHDYSYLVEAEIKNARQKPSDGKIVDSIMLGWDNTPRRGNKAVIFANFSILKYKQWLSFLSHKCINNKRLDKEEKILFINAWNEWAEGTYLEPDLKNGFRSLNSTYKIKKSFNVSNEEIFSFNNFSTSNKHAVLLHVHYEDVIEEITDLCNQNILRNFDIYVTSSFPKILRKIKIKLPHSQTMLVENRGRDTLPLIKKLEHIKNFNYESICIIHSKKSTYREDGESLRNNLYNALLGNEKIIQNIINEFKNNKNIGLIAPKNCLLKHDHTTMVLNKKNVLLACKKTKLSFRKSTFPAGSMFWVRPQALDPLLKLKDEDFEIEEGYTDGCMAHAIERLFCICVESFNLKVISTQSNKIYF